MPHDRDSNSALPEQAKGDNTAKEAPAPAAGAAPRPRPRAATLVGIAPVVRTDAEPIVPAAAPEVTPAHSPPKPEETPGERPQTQEEHPPSKPEEVSAGHPPSALEEVSVQRRAPAPRQLHVKRSPPKPKDSPAGRSPSKPGAAVLMIGGGHAIQTALAEALMRHGMDLETASADSAVSSAVAAAPDLILLVGDAAQNAGTDILKRLGQSPLSQSVPVAILADEPNLAQQLNAFRHGAASVIRRSASVDEIAERIAGLARQMPVAKGSSPDRLEEVTLQDLLSTLSERLRSAVLAGAKPETEHVKLTLRDGRGVAQIVDEFADRMQKHVLRAEAVEYELDQYARGKTALLGDEGTAGAFSAADVRGIRIVIADDHAARADAIAHELRSRGATVLVTNLEPTTALFQRLRQVDPMALVIGDDQADGRGAELIRRARADTRLRWAARVVVHWADVWPEVPDGIQRILGMLASAAEAERNLRERADLSAKFDLRLESLGSTRLLRALAGLPRPVRVTLYNPRLRVELDISEALIAGATGETFGDEEEQKLEGYPALSALLTVGSGRVQIEQVERPACLNIMSPVEVALELADSEPRPIAPSSLLSAVEPPSSLPPPRASNATPVTAPASASTMAIEAETAAGGILKRRVALPMWAFGLALMSAFAFAIIVALLVTSASSAVPAAKFSAVPNVKNAAGRKGDSVLDRARAGDAAAIAELEARESAGKETLEEAVALAEGRAAQRLQAVDQLRSTLGTPARAPRPDEIRQLLELARDPRAAPNAQTLIATLPASIAADLLYEIWIGTPSRTAATELAEQLVYTPSVRDKASPALKVTLDLRRVNKCEDVADLLPRLKGDGDRRALRAVAGLNERIGCKGRSAAKCLSCLPSRSALVSATNAAKRRPSPAF